MPGCFAFLRLFALPANFPSGDGRGDVRQGLDFRGPALPQRWGWTFLGRFR
jgi:hypothetical protein